MRCDRPEALVDAAVLLATDDLLRAQLRPAARFAVESQSWDKVIIRFEADLMQAAGMRETQAEAAIA